MSSRGKRRRAQEIDKVAKGLVKQDQVPTELKPFAEAHSRYMQYGQFQNIISEAMQQADASLDYFEPDSQYREGVEEAAKELSELYTAARLRTLDSALEMARLLDDIDLS